MAKKISSSTSTKLDVPMTLDDNLFFGLKLNKEQKAFRDAIWAKSNDIVFCNSRAGTGKSLIAIATAKLLIEYGLFDKAYYIISPVMNGINGYLPGSIAEKESPYYAPLFDALAKIGDFPEKALSQKEGYWITPCSHVYTRGINFENSVIIIDEAQNFYFDELKKVLTRIHSNSKTICIGHIGQIDLSNPNKSGFEKYLNHFKDCDKCAVCELNINFRGWVSQWADECY